MNDDGLTEAEREIVYARLPLLNRLRHMPVLERAAYEASETDVEEQQHIREQMAFQTACWAKGVLKMAGLEHPSAVKWGLGIAEQEGLLTQEKT